MRNFSIGILGLVCTASVAAGDVTVYTDLASYEAAVGRHDLFVCFELDTQCQQITGADSTDEDINGTADFWGAIFSDDVVYGSPNHGTFPEHVNFFYYAPVGHEIGPMGDWSGVLRWDYASKARATAFTGITLADGAVINLYDEGQLVGSTAFVNPNAEGVVFFGLTSDVPFDRVEIDSTSSYAIDAHYTTYDVCAGDTNGDGVVNVVDLLNVLAAWGSCL